MKAPDAIRSKLPAMLAVLSAAACLIMMALIYLAHQFPMAFVHSSDGTTAYYVYKQVVLNGVPFKDIYTLKGHPMISPPFFLYFLAASAVAGNFYLAQLANALLQAGLLLAAGYCVLRLVHARREALLLFPLLALAVGMALVSLPGTAGVEVDRGSYDLRIMGFFYPIWMADYHFVHTTLLTLLSFLAFTRFHIASSARERWLWLGAFATISLLASGNSLFLVYSTAPVFLATVYLWLVKGLKTRAAALWVPATFASAVANLAIAPLITFTADGVLTGYTELRHYYAYGNIPRIISMFRANLQLQPVLVGALIVLVATGAWLMLKRLWSTVLRSCTAPDPPGPSHILLALITLQAGCVIFILLVSQMVRERYTTGLLYCSMVVCVALAGRLLLTHGRKLATALAPVVLAFFVFQIVHFGAIGVQEPYYPEENRCIDRVAHSYGVTHGIAPYEIANQTEMLSRAGLIITPTLGTLAYRLFVSQQDLIHAFQFVLSSDLRGTSDHFYVDPAMLREHYGEPSAIERCSHYTIYLFERPFSLKLP